jgi:hypothetical protein
LFQIYPDLLFCFILFPLPTFQMVSAAFWCRDSTELDRFLPKGLRVGGVACRDVMRCVETNGVCDVCDRCCHHERLGCPEDIFDCHAGLKDWRHGWSKAQNLKLNWLHSLHILYAHLKLVSWSYIVLHSVLR